MIETAREPFRVRTVIGRISSAGVEAINTANGMVGRGQTVVEAMADLDRQERRAALQEPTP